MVVHVQLVRINLSEQTDVSDLFGSDLPVPDAEDEALSPSDRGNMSITTSDGDTGGGGNSTGARFAWCDGVFLRALKAGKWVLLDELNLATQVHHACIWELKVIAFEMFFFSGPGNSVLALLNAKSRDAGMSFCDLWYTCADNFFKEIIFVCVTPLAACRVLS